ncbi:MAG: 16S rRNA (guanine(527)-N(7))-methyltransferase RsmG [Myxococcales bacterium]|nr:16S rRNA (guanine(527)-N(7))-methyltransferase RsmG [Myxococcales bacterium]
MRDLLEKFNLTPSANAEIGSYVDLLMRWNAKIQMTSTRDEAEFVSRHVADSLELAKHIGSDIRRMIDVGSGGGLPGILLAIVHPDVEFLLIEPTNKKHAFLSTVRRELGLKNLKTKAVRDEQLLTSPDFEPFDAAVARAVWSIEEWLERAPSLLRPGGQIFAMEGLRRAEVTGEFIRHSYELEVGRTRSILCVTASA